MIFALLLGFMGCKGTDAGDDTSTCSVEAMDDNYTRYVEPFVSGSVESSCTECHMTGIDITMYAQDTPCQTLACMVDAGAVDLDDPASSPLLEQIRMGATASSVFDVEDEADAFLEWFEWSAECHEQSCGELESPCSSGTGASSTGVDPLGDCSEEDLLVSFWDAVIVDRSRCDICHSQWAEDNSTEGACTTDEECDEKLECLGGFCKKSGPYYAPHFFEGLEGAASWGNPEDRQSATHVMYNTVALGEVNEDTMLSSKLLTKPLLEGFQPLAIYGPGVEIESIPDGEGVGIPHQGSSKFNFGIKSEPFPESGVIDCRQEKACHSDAECDSDKFCRIPNGENVGWCHLDDSYCDNTYVNYIQFLEYFLSCK